MRKFLNNYINNDMKFDKLTMIGIICLVIVISGIFGFIYEFIFYYLNSGMKTFYYRGGNFLPWINIYAIGSILIYFLIYKFRKNPLKIFLYSTIICGVLEYIAGYLIYNFRGARYWDYNTEILNFGNIGGFVCLRSVLWFGLSSFILMYILNPMGIYLSLKTNRKVIVVLSIFIITIIFLDQIYNLLLADIFNLKNAIQIYKTYGIKYM